MSALGIVLFLAVYIIARVAAGLISKEAAGWAPHVSLSIVRHASRRLPEAHRSRWLEEMEADIAEFAERPISGLFHAVLAARGAGRLARELRPVAVASGVSGAESPSSRSALRERSASAAFILRVLTSFERLNTRLDSRLNELLRAIALPRRVLERLTVVAAGMAAAGLVAQLAPVLNLGLGPALLLGALAVTAIALAVTHLLRQRP